METFGRMVGPPRMNDALFRLLVPTRTQEAVMHKVYWCLSVIDFFQQSVLHCVIRPDNLALARAVRIHDSLTSLCKG